MIDRPRHQGAELMFAGEIFCDLVFAGVDVPQLGTEVYADAFRITAGGVATRAVAAARAGATTLLLSRLGDDPLGEHVHRMLEGEPRLDLRLLERLAGHQSAVTVSLTTPEDRSFITYQVPLGRQGVPEGLGPIRAANVGVADELPDWVAPLRAAGTLIVGGVGWDATGVWSTEVLHRLRQIDIFVPNDAEAMRYTRTDEALAAAKALAEHVPLAVVTRGPRGAVAVDSASGEVVEVDAVPVTVLDPTGAGDVFVATFMAALSTEWDLRTRLRFASLSATLSVTGLGGAVSAPRPADLLDFVERHRPAGDWSFLYGLPDPGRPR